MILSKIGRYVVLLQLAASVAYAASSSSSLTCAAATTTNDVGDVHNHRNLVDCSIFTNGDECTAGPDDACYWQGDSVGCIPASTPTVMADALPGAGYCSDDPTFQCFDTSDCACSSAVSGTKYTKRGDHPLGGRTLQEDDCSSFTTRRSCRRNLTGCEWHGGVCSLSETTRSPPTDAPTMDEPWGLEETTGSTTPCGCLGLDLDAPTLTNMNNGNEEAPTDNELVTSLAEESVLPLVIAGDEGTPPEAFPLSLCQGDCDVDSDCAEPLQCYQRSGTQAVPGCSGAGTSGKDYCAARTTDNSLFLRGNNGYPLANFPLGVCLGDCDNDSECDVGLICHQRTGTEAVPGCDGLGATNQDYCRYPWLGRPGNNGIPAEVFPLGNCRGDCDNDSECASPLKCYQRFGTEAVPGCLGLGSSRVDYCAYRPTDTTLFLKGNNGKPARNFPLGLCLGDCDNDNECDTGLICNERSGTEAVPGCDGLGASDKDYCSLPASTNMPSKSPTPSPSDNPTNLPTVSPVKSTDSPTVQPTDFPTSTPSKTPTLNPVATDSPTNLPTANPVKSTGSPTVHPTDFPTSTPSKTPTLKPVATDSPTKLPTASPTGNPITEAPTSDPTSSPSKSPTETTVSPTKAPTDGPTNSPTEPSIPSLQFAGDEGVPPEAFPLSLCQGDCDNDGDCAGPLLCYQRAATEVVPGCLGVGLSGKDYCAARTTDTTLFLKGDEGLPSANFPLGLCFGDCDEDADCDVGLICEARSGTEAVPGCDGLGVSGKDYCRYPSLAQVGNNGSPSEVFPLGNCLGDCDNDSECADNDNECASPLKCYQRYGTEAVPGCLGVGDSEADYCACRTTDTTLFLKGDEGIPSANFPLGLCEGDCDNNNDCDEGLICEGRSGTQAVPGCDGLGASGKDYCRYPYLAQVGNNGSPTDVFPLGNCRGDCDNDSECAGTLKCYQRAATEAVPGCLGAGDSGADYCAYRPTDTTLFLKGNNGGPARNFPLGLCLGDCDNDAECEGALVCKERSGTQAVPGCDGLGVSGKDYCYDLNPGPTDPPAPQPTHSPNTFGATYVPGDLSVLCDNGKLKISKGMGCKLLTTAGDQVELKDGTLSTEAFHAKADGAGVIPHPTDGGWYYASNSEASSGNGGVGSLRFDASGDVVGYERNLVGTSRNCGGGRTFWNTWVTCEENGNSGYCHEVDPFTGHTSQVKNVFEGGNYESFAYDNQDPDVTARYFTTEDSSNGALVRYTPHSSAYASNYTILTTDNGSHDYLVLNTLDGTFSWSSDITDGEASAAALFPSSEGIDVHNRMLNFVSKVNKELFSLDLEAGTWTSTTTVSGAFDLMPDQLARIMGDSVLYFCEDGGSRQADIHARDSSGQYYTIVEGVGYTTETTGLAFSPDGLYMYVAYQRDSNIYSFWREDGLPFNGLVAYTKYHAV